MLQEEQSLWVPFQYFHTTVSLFSTPGNRSNSYSNTVRQYTPIINPISLRFDLSVCCFALWAPHISKYERLNVRCTLPLCFLGCRIFLSAGQNRKAERDSINSEKKYISERAGIYFQVLHFCNTNVTMQMTIVL